MKIHACLTLLFAGLVLWVAGCGTRTGDVRGKVTYAKQAVTSGSIQFMASDGIVYPVTIQSDGTYRTRIPLGDAKAVVSSIDEKRAKEFGDKMKSEKGGPGRGKITEPEAVNFSNIPMKYSAWETSGLKLKVSSGSNVNDIDLVD